MVKQFLAKDYGNRQDLESGIKVEVGTNIESNRTEGHTIEGTREELKKLYLTDLTAVFGIKCVITDNPTSQILADKKAEREKAEKPKKKTK